MISDLTIEQRMLVEGRCRECVTGMHEHCIGLEEGRTRCGCYCIDILEDDEEVWA